MSESRPSVPNRQPKNYKVVFWGQAAVGVPRQQLATRFAQMFRIRSAEQLKPFFSGRLKVLKSGLTEAQARTYAAALEAIGAVCRVECTQVLALEGELAHRHRPSFLQPGLTADEMTLAPD